jgi:hypothetical protein
VIGRTSTKAMTAKILHQIDARTFSCLGLESPTSVTLQLPHRK